MVSAVSGELLDIIERNPVQRSRGPRNRAVPGDEGGSGHGRCAGIAGASADVDADRPPSPR